MTPEEWRTSQNPQAMMRHLTHDFPPGVGVLVRYRPLPKSRVPTERMLWWWAETEPRLRRHFPERAGGEPNHELIHLICCDYALASVVVPDSQTEADALRDAVGDPWRQYGVDGRGLVVSRVPELALWAAPAGPRHWLCDWASWQDNQARRLSRAILAEGNFADLPVLADCLEESGCDFAPILDHLRLAQPHFSCCWCLRLFTEDQPCPKNP